ncbi:NAD(P)-dependent dehydrogenase, short-chain alcohol dehydrogenase family [Aquimarina amphilecti]|uniref:NAD(P)-dependent dehydrogenase, short-chain alcohol dehydrogenase family n=1 Tax=Aquimarina amphilecti TaxID=1038014 RepID=A0A1H7H797_AQUAM|nr:SDR family NAD(P)-dependent oxidoreductase [Aquimarina amphilecti]SEK46171.1 NAD(P)-dependent dehydrogenase, short-chain alcohol dehydrogenase family [Aquimarina amphilecti]
MKIILITGSTDGIGKLTALKLAKEGHKVYLHGRSSDKLANTISEIKEESGNQNIDGFVADFSDINAVKQMTEDVKAKVPKLDVLINNAGIFKTSAVSKFKGFDIRFVVNYLAAYALTNGILQVLQNGDHTRIVNLSSAAQSHVSDATLTGVTMHVASEAYAQSKLALTMWSFAFAKANPEIITIAVNPGSLLNTKMAKEAYGQHWSPAEKGVNILYDLAMSKDHENDSGKYFDNDKGTFAKAHPDAYDEGLINRLLTTTDSLLA